MTQRQITRYRGLTCLLVCVLVLMGCSSPTPVVLLTPTPSPTATQPPTATPAPTVTHTPSPTPTPLPPLAIESLRQGNYPGSPLITEEELTPGGNYDRSIVSYRSEGLKIYALLTVPRGDPPEAGWPVVVFNHGYIPPEQYRTTERYIAYVDGFARSGYIVLRPDYRGHGSSEGIAAGAYSAPDYTVDVLNAVASIKAYPAADPERIGMWGHSMGGSITLQVMVSTQDVKAGVIWAGMVGTYPDILNWFQDRWGSAGLPTPDPDTGSRPGVAALVTEYGSPEENPAFWSSISATSYLRDLSGPLQIHHGTGDTTVPFVWSEALYTMLQETEQPAEFYSYTGDDHNISNQFSLAMERSLQFFDTHLKGAN